MGFKLVHLIAVGVLGLGNLLHIIGLATPEWVTVSAGDVSQGLWQGCIQDHCIEISSLGMPDWFKACRALSIIGMLVGLAALGMAAFVFLLSLLGKDSPKVLSVFSAMASVMACVIILICVIVYAAKFEKLVGSADGRSFGYSFGLSIAGGVLVLMGGIVSFKGGQS